MRTEDIGGTTTNKGSKMSATARRMVPIAILAAILIALLLLTQHLPNDKVDAAALPTKPVARVLPKADRDGDTRFACLGDSNADLSCSLGSNSIISHALLRKNRRWFLEPNSGNNPDGSNFAASGSSSGTNGCPGQMNCPTRLAAVSAFNPDILFIWVGRNENSSGSITTVENITAAVDHVLTRQPSNRLRAVIVLPVVPGSEHNFVPRLLNAQQMASNRQMRQALLDLAKVDPLYHVFDVAARFVDLNAASPMPIGGLDGGPGAVLVDGIHPSQTGARRVADEFNALLDTLDVKPAAPVRLDEKSAASANLVSDGNGRFMNGGGAIGTGGSGQAPAGFRVSSDDAELSWKGYVRQPYTDVRGVHRTGYGLSISARAPLTGDRSLSLQTLLDPLKFRVGHIYALTMHARIAGSTNGPCAGLTNLALTLSYPVSQAKWLTYGQDIMRPGTANASDLLDIASTEDRDYQIPAITIRTSPIAPLYLRIVPRFRAGSAPASCQILLSDLVARQIG